MKESTKSWLMFEKNSLIVKLKQQRHGKKWQNVYKQEINSLFYENVNINEGGLNYVIFINIKYIYHSLYKKKKVKVEKRKGRKRLCFSIIFQQN